MQKCGTMTAAYHQFYYHVICMILVLSASREIGLQRLIFRSA